MPGLVLLTFPVIYSPSAYSRPPSAHPPARRHPIAVLHASVFMPFALLLRLTFPASSGCSVSTLNSADCSTQALPFRNASIRLQRSTAWRGAA